LQGFAIQPEAVAVGHYVGSLAPAEARLRDACNGLLRAAMRDGTLERIFRKWGVWNDDQARLYTQLLAGESVAPVTILDGASGMTLDAVASVAAISRWEATARYLPPLLRASIITLVLSCLSMALAVAIGIAIATGRVYGGRSLRGALVAYVELMRGTPILLQLFVLYYGIAEAVRLPAFAAALAGLALNYAAYESEIYRAALEAISPGQLEAARTLGLSERQVVWRLRR
jgi:polar amino acid transport system substrate-binding protein